MKIRLVLHFHLKEICKIYEIWGYSHFLRMPILLLAGPLASEEAESLLYWGNFRFVYSNNTLSCLPLFCGHKFNQKI